MKDNEIIVKAIQQAIKNGWQIKRIFNLQPNWILYNDGSGIDSYDSDDDWIDYEILIFNHSFAKAFWGEELGYINVMSNPGPRRAEAWRRSDKETTGYYPRWVYHLEMMVKEEKPLNYLEKFLVGKK